MNAICLHAPRQLARIELAEPADPGPGQALVAVRHIGLCGTDVSGYLGKMPFIQYPRILGHELGVEILRLGPDVGQLQPGDLCAVEPYLHCGHCHACTQGRTNCCEQLRVLGVHTDGGMVERLLLPAAKLHPSRTLTTEQLALVETLGIGRHAVDRAQLAAGEDVVILGAGPIGLSVLEFVRHGERTITVMDLNAQRREFVATHYPDVQVLADPPAGFHAQVVFDATGSALSMARALHLARFTGRVVWVGITAEPVALDDALFHRRELTLLASRNALSADFPRIIHAIETGQIDTRPWMTHRASLADLPQLLPEWLDTPGPCWVKAILTP